MEMKRNVRKYNGYLSAVSILVQMVAVMSENSVAEKCFILKPVIIQVLARTYFEINVF
jgi:hypothetical protein